MTFLLIRILPATAQQVEEDSMSLYDQDRDRVIPIALYKPAVKPKGRQQLIIFSHGYGANKPGSNREYSYLTRFLAAQGYLVASIQHELPGDSLLPTAGIPRITRRSNWERGAENIMYVIQKFKRLKPELNYRNIILIGHSNGGDMSMLFAGEHPGMISKVISLDNRRMPLPRRSSPRIITLRSSDQTADEGVLPTAAEQDRYHIKVITFDDIKHGDMDDKGTPEQKTKITATILQLLND